MTNIFFARAYHDYGTEYENDIIKKIKEKWNNCDIIQLPKIEEIEKESNIKYGQGLLEKERDYFFPLINECDIFVMCPINNEFNKDGSKRTDKGKLTEGVRFEALHALSIGKQLYHIDSYRTTQIKTINELEELIKSIYTLNKKFNRLLNDNIRELINSEKRLPTNIHPKITGLYERNKNIRDIMKGFLNGNRVDIEYIKPITIQIRYPITEAPIRYLPYGTRHHFSLEDLNIEDIKKYKGEMHFYETFLDKKILDDKRIDIETQEIIINLIKKGKKEKNFKPWMVFNKYILGVGIVFDIDAPKELEKTYGKANMFEEKWYKEFMLMKDEAEKLANQIELKCVSSTTGNGFNVTCEPYWFDERNDTFDEFRETISNGIENINMSHNDIGVRIDEKITDWSMFKKMPFTYHAKWNRITLPVNKGKLDREWLMNISDIDNFMKNEKENLNEVIEKSKWNEDKWW